MLRELPFGNDGDFSHRAMINRMNSELANDLGNLSQRVLSMVAKNCGGAVPQPGALSSADETLLGAANALLEGQRAAYDTQAFHKALDAVFDVVGRANRYVDEQAPWTLRKTDPARMATVLYTLVETIRHVAILLQPIVPGSCERMLDQLAVPADARGFDRLTPEHRLVPGTPLPKPEGVFPRWVAEEEEAGS
jgi:methionyl-tRNA synthetase